MENKEFKFVCPDCGGCLVAWEEKIFEEVRGIEEDGSLGEYKVNGKSIWETGCFGIKCVSCGGTTYANGESTFTNKEWAKEIERKIEW